MDVPCAGRGKALIAHLLKRRLDALPRQHPLPATKTPQLPSSAEAKSRQHYAPRLRDWLWYIGAPVFDQAGTGHCGIRFVRTGVQIT
jgi:hypothetical protein